ncbi:MAG: hypothetical protein KOO61_00800 [Spirochaetales bacterium]|nr:hypothetical protein [Spirochaetales bacterium]
MRRYISAVAGMALVVLVGFLASCTQSPIGLFESIELEQKIIDDRDLDNELLVGGMTESGGYYFIAAATLWTRDVDEMDAEGLLTQWASITPPGASNFTTSSLVTFDGSGTELIYAAYSSQDGTEGGVYTVDPAADAVQVATDPVFGTDVDGVAGVGKVFVANDGTDTYLLVAVKKSDVTSRYSVYASTTGDAGTFAEVAGTERNLPVIDVAENAAGAIGFLTEKAVLIDSDGLDFAPDPTTITDVAATLGIVDRQPVFGGIYLHPATGTLWVTDNEGYLYQGANFGATWSANTAAHLVSTSDESPLQFADLVAVDNGGTDLLVVGTEGHGYRELDALDFSPTTPAAEVSNYQASELAQATILTFYVDEGATGDFLFAGTSNLGLWKVLYGGDPPQWIRE